MVPEVPEHHNYRGAWNTDALQNIYRDNLFGVFLKLQLQCADVRKKGVELEG